MEYIISNMQFPSSELFGDIYYQGQFKLTDTKLQLLEGFVVEESGNILDENSKGVYNYIEYDKISGNILIKNDHLGQYTLYYYIKGNHLIIGNNLWRIVSVLQNHSNLLNIDNMKQFIFAHRILSEGATLFNNIYQLPAATKFEYSLATNKLNCSKYWNIIQKPDKSISLDDAVCMLDSDIKDLFTYLNNRSDLSSFGFGNSGGLDSRIIPLYAKKIGMDISGYTIGQRKQRGVFTSISHRNAESIAKHLDFNTYHADVRSKSYDDRLLLDIRNNPLSGNQIFKNPYENIRDYDGIICGGNGFIISNDSNTWKAYENINSNEEKINFLFSYLSKEKFSGKYTNVLRIRKYIGLKYNQNQSDNLLSKWFDKEQIELFRDTFCQFFNQYKHFDNFSQIRNVHLLILNKQSPNGGLESINRLRNFFYLYYPFALHSSLQWKSDYFYDRKVLTGLLLKSDAKLAAIFDQKMNRIGKKTGKLRRFSNIVFRGSGMELNRWTKEPSFKDFTNNTFMRNNELFNKVVPSFYKDYGYLYKTHPFFWLDLLKIKKVCDIIYFNELDTLNRNDFLMV